VRPVYQPHSSLCLCLSGANQNLSAFSIARQCCSHRARLPAGRNDLANHNLTKRVDKEEFVLYNLIVLQLIGYGMLTSYQMDATFAALADSTRRAILLRLASGEASVNELAKPFRMSQPAVSKHLKVLERAGLISVGQDAQRRPRRIQPARLAEASAWLERFREFWEGSFWRLDNLLEEMKSSEHAAKRCRHRRKRP
jgi:DNA-binding transcriptional ArsR family regulator